MGIISKKRQTGIHAKATSPPAATPKTNFSGHAATQSIRLELDSGSPKDEFDVDFESY